MMSQGEIRTLLRRKVAELGGRRPLAAFLGISESYLGNLLTASKPPTGTILDRLGLHEEAKAFREEAEARREARKAESGARYATPYASNHVVRDPRGQPIPKPLIATEPAGIADIDTANTTGPDDSIESTDPGSGGTREGKRRRNHAYAGLIGESLGRERSNREYGMRMRAKIGRHA